MGEATKVMAIEDTEDIMARDLLRLKPNQKLKLKLILTMVDTTEDMEDIMEVIVATMEDTGAMDTMARDLLIHPQNLTMDTEAIEDTMEDTEDIVDMATDATMDKLT